MQRVETDLQPQQNAVPSQDVCETHTQSQSGLGIGQESPADSQVEAENAALVAEVARYRERNAELMESFTKLNADMKKKKIDSFEMLAEQDKEAKQVLIELARRTEPMPMEGKNIGLFGLTSTGKSTLLNKLLGADKAKTGHGETTLAIEPYTAPQYTLWDVPGRNDEIAYFNMEYIAFFKGLSRRFVLIQATVKENSSMMKLLDEIGLRYDIVFNKFDIIDDEDQPKVQQQIKQEIISLGLKGVDRVFFVSAKKPQMFPDWLKMVNHLTD
jgi:GTP-binding protein EngB required for normal cell division